MKIQNNATGETPDVACEGLLEPSSPEVKIALVSHTEVGAGFRVFAPHRTCCLWEAPGHVQSSGAPNAQPTRGKASSSKRASLLNAVCAPCQVHPERSWP